MHAVLASRMLCTVSATQLKEITSGLEKMEKKAKKGNYKYGLSLP